MQSSDPAMSFPRRIRTREAAQMLGLSPGTLAKLRCIGGGPLFTKLGRVVVYAPSDLLSWADAHGKRGSTSTARAA